MAKLLLHNNLNAFVLVFFGWQQIVLLYASHRVAQQLPAHLSKSGSCILDVAALQNQGKFKWRGFLTALHHVYNLVRERSKPERGYVLWGCVPSHLMSDDRCGWTQNEVSKKQGRVQPEGRGRGPNTPTGIAAWPWWQIAQCLLKGRMLCLMYYCYH